MSDSFPAPFGEPVSVFTHRGYECRVYIGPSGNPNGYAAIPNASFHGYDEVNPYFWWKSLVGCNGEWTYCNRVGNVTIIGFDTSHSHDGPETQNVEWVADEIKRGVDNLIHLSFAPLLEGDEQTHHTGEQALTLGYMIDALFAVGDEGEART